MESLAARLDWERRPTGFGRVTVIDWQTIGFEVELRADSPLARAWTSVHAHWNMLEPIGASPIGRLRLRYAALVQPPHHGRDTTWGQQIVRAYARLSARLTKEQLALFAYPRAHVDLDNNVRLEFLDGPPRALTSDRELVEVALEALGQLAPELADRPALRDAPTLQLMNVALCARGLRTEPPTAKRWLAWTVFEHAAGMLAAGEPRRAGELAIAMSTHAFRGSLIVAAGDVAPELITTQTVGLFRASQVASRVAQLSPREAIELLRAVHDRPLELEVLHARIASGLGEYRRVDFRRLLEISPDDVGYLRGRATQLLDNKDAAAARIHIERWLTLAPDDPAAHAMLGNALKLLGHPAQARAAHDEAAKRGYLPSQFARTNLDRDAKQLRSVAGSEGYRDLSVPEHLRDVVPLLSQGRLLDAILWLTDRYADPEARALLATCYEYAGDPDSALHVHEADDNRAGIARCLIALGRRDEAFARVGDDAALIDELRELAGLPAERIAWTR